MKTIELTIQADSTYHANLIERAIDHCDCTTRRTLRKVTINTTLWQLPEITKALTKAQTASDLAEA